MPCPALPLVCCRWRYMQGACSMTCGGGVARRARYCARSSEGTQEEEVLSDSECLAVPRPLDTVECNTEPCPARYTRLIF